MSKLNQVTRKNKKPLSRRKRFLKYMGNVGLAFFSIAFATTPVQAVEIDEAVKVLGSEGGKQALNEALKVSKTKPALSVAACITVAGANPVHCMWYFNRKSTRLVSNCGRLINCNLSKSDFTEIIFEKCQFDYIGKVNLFFTFPI